MAWAWSDSGGEKGGGAKIRQDLIGIVGVARPGDKVGGIGMGVL